jgi:hypothetical protein
MFQKLCVPWIGFLKEIIVPFPPLGEVKQAIYKIYYIPISNAGLGNWVFEEIHERAGA